MGRYLGSLLVSFLPILYQRLVDYRYQGFKDRGFQVGMIFDNDPEIIGTDIGGFTVLDIATLSESVQEAGIKVAMLAIPARFAQEVTEQLIDAGVKAILNYAPIQLTTPKEVRVQYIDPATHLQNMSYYLE